MSTSSDPVRQPRDGFRHEGPWCCAPLGELLRPGHDHPLSSKGRGKVPSWCEVVSTHRKRRHHISTPCGIATSLRYAPTQPNKAREEVPLLARPSRSAANRALHPAQHHVRELTPARTAASLVIRCRRRHAQSAGRLGGGASLRPIGCIVARWKSTVPAASRTSSDIRQPGSVRSKRWR